MDNNNFQPVFNPGMPPQAPQPTPGDQSQYNQLAADQPMQPQNPGPQGNGPVQAPSMKDAQAMLAAQSNRITIWMTISIIAMIVGVTFIGLFIWINAQLTEAKTNVDGKIQAAVANAVNEKSKELSKKFEDDEKSPYKMFAGPSDYGSLSFEYPKTWSLYEQRDSSTGGDYYAYINPDKVPPIDGENPIAVHVEILNENFDEYISTYKSDVEDGTMTLTIDMVGGINANIYRGEFDNGFIGIAAVFKLRDKTVVIQTDANSYEADFNRILKTVSFSS